MKSGNAYMRPRTGLSLVKIKACRPLGLKPATKPMVAYFQLGPWEWGWGGVGVGCGVGVAGWGWCELNHKAKFSVKKMYLQISLQYVRHFVQPSMS